jgi:hypothetical protein
MKLARYASNKDNPAIKGTLTAEEIVRADWERHYEKKGIPLDVARLSVKAHVDNGGAVFRLRNTLILVTPAEDWSEVEFHTITADLGEVYQTLMLLFFLGLNKSKGTQIAFTYINDRNAYRMAKKLFGADFVDIDESDDPDKGRYSLVIDIGSMASAAQTRQAMQGGAQ